MRKVQKVYKNIYFTTLVKHMCEFDVVVDYWYSESFVSQITGCWKNTDHHALLTTRMSNEKNLLWTNEYVKRSGIPPIIGEFLQHLYMVYYIMFKVHKNVKVETKSAYLRKRYVTNSTAQDCKAYATQLYIQTL